MNEFQFEQPHPEIYDWFLTEELASNKWNEVYRAQPKTTTQLNRGDYVLKIARNDDENQVASTLLQREAQIAQVVKHPNLVSILDACFDSKPYFVVQPFLPGINLETVISCHPKVSVPFALWIIRQVAQGLDALHGQNILHSDISPRNIMASPDGHVTLLDLGMAQVISEDPQAVQHLAGSLNYLAPEQLESAEQLTLDVDVFALGMVAFQLLTGQLPSRLVKREQDAELLMSRLSGSRLDDTAIEQNFAITEVFTSMLELIPADRPSINEVVSMLIRCEIDSFAARTAA